MNVLAFTQLYPSPMDPTLGVFNLQTFRALGELCELRVVVPLAAHAHHRHVSALVAPYRGTMGGVEALYPAYVSIPRLPMVHGQGMYRSLRGRMERFRKSFRYDVVVSAWAYPDNYAAAKFAHEAGVPLMTAVMGSDINLLPGFFGVRSQLAWGLEQAARVLSVSHAMVESLRGLGVSRERIIVQHNAVDGERFAIRDRTACRRKVGIEHNRPVVGYIGNLRWVKGSDQLIEIMDHLVHRLGRHEVQLVVVGSGELEATMRTRAAALGLGRSNVRFCGRKLHDEIPFWMNAFDVFCLPSRREGCPNVVLEALASGKPVVGSRAGGIPELIQDGGNGFLVPVEDTPALAQGLDAALSRSWDAMALRDTVEFLSWRSVGETYLWHLETILREHTA